MVAQYADACNIFDMGPDAVKAKYDVIRGHCADVGRDDDEIEKTVLSRMDFANESDDQMVDRFGALAAIGTDHVILGNAGIAGFEKPGYLDRVPGLVQQLESL